MKQFWIKNSFLSTGLILTTSSSPAFNYFNLVCLFSPVGVLSLKHFLLLSQFETEECRGKTASLRGSPFSWSSPLKPFLVPTKNSYQIFFVQTAAFTFCPFRPHWDVNREAGYQGILEHRGKCLLISRQQQQWITIEGNLFIFLAVLWVAETAYTMLGNSMGMFHYNGISPVLRCLNQRSLLYSPNTGKTGNLANFLTDFH